MDAPIFNNGKRYNDYSSFIKSRFSQRVQKVSINTGFSCPNRDGSKGLGGCTYCNNNSFKPFYTKPNKSVSQQLEEGIAFFSKKYKTQQYLAYFQSYTNTYTDIDILRDVYWEAVNHPGVIGLVVGTRPDCISEEILNLLEEISKDHYVALEFGVESTLNRTLALINRCHTYEETKVAYEKAAGRGLHLGAHMILGLPGESREEMLRHAIELSKLPIQTLKLHHLQIIKNTRMAVQLKETPEMFQLFQPDEYVDFVTEFIALLRPDIILERFIAEAPTGLLVAPQWNGLKNFEVVSKIDKALMAKDTWQGKAYVQLNRDHLSVPY
jgi:hypothetical protein